jgi:hypothetical protein
MAVELSLVTGRLLASAGDADWFRLTELVSRLSHCWAYQRMIGCSQLLRA